MMRKWAFLAVMPLFVACGDADGDGLSAGDEKDLGTDPKVADSDGDGLLDGDEVTAGTNALVQDSDGDGALDKAEVDVGADPLDPESYPYIGGWPNRSEADKQATEDTGPSGGEATTGKRFKRFRMVDQFEQEVDLYDFAGGGKPIIIDVSAEWCPPCNDMAAWLIGDNDNWNEVLGAGTREAVEAGDVWWITILGENDDFEIADPKTSKRWYREYRDPKVPVLSDTTGNAVSFADIGYWPTLYLLDENMEILARDEASGAPSGQDAIREMFGE